MMQASETSDFSGHRRQLGPPEPLLVVERGFHHPSAEEPPVKIDKGLGRLLGSLELHEDPHRLVVGEVRLCDLKDQHAGHHPVLGALRGHLVLQFIIDLPRPDLEKRDDRGYAQGAY